MRKHIRSIKMTPTRFSFIFKDLIEFAAELYSTSTSTKCSYLCYFVRYHIGTGKTGHLVQGRETESAWG